MGSTERWLASRTVCDMVGVDEVWSIVSSFTQFGRKACLNRHGYGRVYGMDDAVGHRPTMDNGGICGHPGVPLPYVAVCCTSVYTTCSTSACEGAVAMTN